MAFASKPDVQFSQLEPTDRLKELTPGLLITFVIGAVAIVLCFSMWSPKPSETVAMSSPSGNGTAGNTGTTSPDSRDSLERRISRLEDILLRERQDRIRTPSSSAAPPAASPNATHTIEERLDLLEGQINLLLQTMKTMLEREKQSIDSPSSLPLPSPPAGAADKNAAVAQPVSWVASPAAKQALVPTPLFSQAVTRSDARPIVYLGLILLSIFYVIAILTVFFSRLPRRIQLAEEWTRTLTGFFIGIVTGLLGLSG